MVCLEKTLIPRLGSCRDFEAALKLQFIPLNCWFPLKSLYGETSWNVFLKNLQVFSTEERNTWMGILVLDLVGVSKISGNFNSVVNYSGTKVSVWQRRFCVSLIAIHWKSILKPSFCWQATSPHWQHGERWNKARLWIPMAHRALLSIQISGELEWTLHAGIWQQRNYFEAVMSSFSVFTLRALSVGGASPGHSF